MTKNCLFYAIKLFFQVRDKREEKIFRSISPGLEPINLRLWVLRKESLQFTADASRVRLLCRQCQDLWAIAVDGIA